MSFRLLYIEDDLIDVLALKRVLKNFEQVELTVCGTLEGISSLNFDNFDFILSDSNLPDGSLNDLKAILPLDKTHFVSGSEILGEDVWIKPIELDQIKSLFNRNTIVNMRYINELADGDDEYLQEMLDTALRVLPERWIEISSSKNDIVELKKAVHKIKSSYRVCGIQNQWLVELEELNESSFHSEHKDILLAQIYKQIQQALVELTSLKG
jgi:CheY-like chemotaxis protein